MQVFTRLFVLLLLFLFGCGGGGKKESYRIGVDASWYPLDLNGRDHNVTAFSTDLLREIGIVEKVSFSKVTVNWDNLMLGLQKGKYDGVLNCLTPYIFNEKTFDFSKPYLLLGPVLVVRMDSTITGLDQLKGKEIAVISGSVGGQILQNAPGVLIRDYMQIPDALNDILKENIDGALIDVLTATAYCQDMYQGQLKVVTAPLNDEGLRLIAPYTSSPEMIRTFNEGLEKVKKSGKYDELLAKWGL